MDRHWAVALIGPLCIALGMGIAPIMPASGDDRASPAGTRSEHVRATAGDAIGWFSDLGHPDDGASS